MNVGFSSDRSSFFARWFQKRYTEARPNERVLCLDFDGVLHRFETPFADPAVIPDPPVPLAGAFVRAALLAYDRVVICSCRARVRRGRRAIRRWLEVWGFPQGLEVTCRKPFAEAYLDDRGIRFEGSWPWDLVRGDHHA